MYDIPLQQKKIYMNVLMQILLFYLSPAFLQAPVERLQIRPHAWGCYYQHQPEREREREREKHEITIEKSTLIQKVLKLQTTEKLSKLLSW